MSKFKLAVFDWNGTLTSMEQERVLTYGSVQEIFRRYGLEAPPQDVYFAETSTNFMEDFYYPHGIPRTASKDELNAIKVEYILSRFTGQLLRPNVDRTLLDCQVMGLKCAIVSGEQKPLLDRGLDETGLRGFFIDIVSDAYPKRVELAKTLERLKVPPAYAFYVDDSYEGLKAAKEVGMTAIGIKGGFGPLSKLTAANPDVIISELPDLLTYLELF